MICGHSISTCFFAAITSLTLAIATPGQERTSEDVLTLDRAIEWTRAFNRGSKRAKFDVDGQREASAKAKTAYYPCYDTYLLAKEFERRAWGNAYDASSGRGHSAAQTHDLLSYSRYFCRYTRSRAGSGRARLDRRKGVR